MEGEFLFAFLDDVNIMAPPARIRFLYDLLGSKLGTPVGAKKGVKGWAGWIPRSENEKSKFQELVLCPSGDRTGIWKDVLD